MGSIIYNPAPRSRRCSLISTRSIRKLPAVRERWLPCTVACRACALRPHGALARGYAVCEKPVADTLVDLLRKRLGYLTKDRGLFRRRAECAHRGRRRAILPRHLLLRPGVVEFARPAMSNTLERLLAERGTEAQAVVWAHNSAYRQCRLYRDGPGARRAQYRAARAPAFRRRGRADRFRHRPRHGRRRPRTGTG